MATRRRKGARRRRSGQQSLLLPLGLAALGIGVATGAFGAVNLPGLFAGFGLGAPPPIPPATGYVQPPQLGLGTPGVT